MTPAPPPGTPRIVVTGATGAVGSQLARRLAEPGARAPDVRLLVRDPGKVERMGLPGTVVHADYEDRPGIARAMDGADAVFLVTANPLRPQHDENIVRAARTAGVRRVVKVSWLAVTDPEADDLITRWNRECEELLRASGLEWTVLRLRSLMSNTRSWASSIRSDSTVRSFGGDAPTAAVDPRDVARVAAHALTSHGHAGRTYALSGPRPITAREQTEELARALGRPLGFVELTPDQALARWRKGLPEQVAQALLEGARRRAGGAAAQVEGDVEAVTGRAPTAFGSWADDHLGWFR